MPHIRDQRLNWAGICRQKWSESAREPGLGERNGGKTGAIGARNQPETSRKRGAKPPLYRSCIGPSGSQSATGDGTGFIRCTGIISLQQWLLTNKPTNKDIEIR